MKLLSLFEFHKFREWCRHITMSNDIANAVISKTTILATLGRGLAVLAVGRLRSAQWSKWTGNNSSDTYV